MSAIRVYLACSLDGFIAGPDNELSWLLKDRTLPGNLPPDPGALRFEPFMAQVGAILMGRTTYDVVEKMESWPYGDTPVIVSTHRDMRPARSTVRAAAGSIQDLIQEAKEVAKTKDVYLDGGDLVRQALDASMVDEITLTLVPTLLGAGTRLFENLRTSAELQFLAHHTFDNGLVQLRAQVVRD